MNSQRVLDAGVLGVIFPFTRTPELARQAVAACRYPTRGLRGSGANLAQFRWPAPQGYYDFADENVLVQSTATGDGHTPLDLGGTANLAVLVGNLPTSAIRFRGRKSFQPGIPSERHRCRSLPLCARA